MSAAPLTVKYQKFDRPEVSGELLQECATLFSGHYGTWAEDHPDTRKRGRSIRLSAAALRSFIPDADSWVATARVDGRLRIPYLNGALFEIDDSQSRVDTRFHQDTSTVNDKLRHLLAEGAAWRLEQLLPGYEWLGATFSSQTVEPWTSQEANRVLVGARDIAQQAYERMAAAEPGHRHPWAKHASAEVDALLQQASTSVGAMVLGPTYPFSGP